MILRIGIIGFGQQVRNYYLPLMLEQEKLGEIKIAWISGYLDSDAGIVESLAPAIDHEPRDAWQHLISREKIDAILVSLPNSLHEAPLWQAFDCGIHAAVDKPPTIGSDSCAELYEISAKKNLIFLTIAQRRYEKLYQVAKNLIQSDAIGEPRLISYSIFHEEYPSTWQGIRTLSGGGALISSGYHGLDIVLWLLKHMPTPDIEPIIPISVSARWILNKASHLSTNERVETSIVVRVHFSNDAILQVMASFENPLGSIDESIRILGTNGILRITRERFTKTDQSAASMNYQERKSGLYRVYDTSSWSGDRNAPLRDFLDALKTLRQEGSYKIQSSAKDSIVVLKIIEAAYQSAETNGQEIHIQ